MALGGAVVGGKVAATDPVALVLLRRSGLVAPGLLGGQGKVKVPRRRAAGVAGGVVALEADVLARGFLVGPRLRGHLTGLPVERLVGVGAGLLAALDRLVGAHVPHVPLFRRFPRSVPENTAELYVRRVFTLLLQEPRQPCVLCGAVDTVEPVAPCAHLVCHRCWDGADYSACPICHRRISQHDPFLRPTPAPGGAGVPALPRRAVVLELADDVNAAVHRTVAALLARATPLAPQDRDDLTVLLDRVGHGDLGWLPGAIPVRETRALVLGRLFADPELVDRRAELLGRYVDTATDLLRLLHVMFGGDAGLVTAPAVRLSLPRRLRRTILLRLHKLPFAGLVDDLFRHRRAWLRVAENLHPFDQADRHPRAALAFAVLRGTTVDADTEFGRLLLATAAEQGELVRLVGDQLRVTRWSGRLEQALRSGVDADALRLLAQRPGELARRLVAVAGRAEDTDALLAVVRDALPAVSPGVLIAALGAVRAASWPAGDRLYHPRGGSARLWTEPDRRPRLAAAVGNALDQAITAELLDRAGRLSTVENALLDTGLADLVAPFTERTASGALVRLPRGSAQPLPGNRVVRLFLHWTQPEDRRVDLDLSVALFDGAGSFLAWCDYTRLRYGGDAAVHSGDLTSAPAPLGASEFVDLKIPDLVARGVRYVTMVVFSFNDVPFEAMTDAFAGVMADPPRGSAAFEPSAVEQRFDLTGRVRVATPLLLDLAHGRMRWLDANLTGAGGTHSVARYSATLGLLTAAADRYFAAGTRVSVWELACWHAAARAETTTVRHGNGSLVAYRREPGETVAAYASRLIALGPTGAEPAGGRPDLAALVRGDAEVAERASVFALYPSQVDTGRATPLDAADLVAALARQ